VLQKYFFKNGVKFLEKSVLFQTLVSKFALEEQTHFIT